MSSLSDASKQSSTRPLHFVNTDAGTIGSKDDGKRTRDVKSHLSGHYRRWKKQHNLGSSTGRNEPQQILDSRCTHVGVCTNLPDHDKLSLTQTMSCNSDFCCEDDGTAEDVMLQNNSWAKIDSTTLHNALSHGNSDPFNAFPLIIDPQTNLYVKMYLESTSISCWKTQIDERLKCLLHNEALMHGILAISKIIAAVYMQNRPNSTTLLPESREHYVQLLRLMRSTFEDNTNIDHDLAIEMIHAAVTFSFLAREYDEFELHLLSLKSLIDNLGGIKNISSHHSDRFLNVERLRGLFLLRKPSIPIAEWAPGSWYQEQQLRPFDVFHDTGMSLMSSCQPLQLPEGPLAQRTRALVLDHRDMLAGGSVAAMLFRTKQTGVDVITDWMHFRNHALTMETAEIIREAVLMKRIKPTIEVSLHASACLAANFAGHLIHFSVNPTIGLTYVPFPILTQNLQDVHALIQQGTTFQHQELYLWALFIGACAELASRTWSCDPSSRGSTWCSTHLSYMIERLSFNTMDELKDTLRQYLFPFMFVSYLRVLFEKRHELIKLAIDT